MIKISIKMVLHVPRLDVPIRSCIALYDLDMRRCILLLILYVYSYVILYERLATCRGINYVPGSDCVGILVYAKRSIADFDNDNIMIFSFHL